MPEVTDTVVNGGLKHQIARQISKIRTNPYLSGGIIYMAGSVVNKGIAFLSVPVFAYLLNPSELGRATVFVSWHAIFMIVLNLSTNASLFNANSDFGDKRLDEYASSIITLGTISSILISSLLLLLPVSLIDAVFGISRTWIILGLLSATVSFPFLVAVDVARVRKQAMLYNLFAFLSTTSAILLSIVLIWFLRQKGDIDTALGRVLGVVIAHIALGLFYLVRRLAIGRKFIDLNYWKYALRISLPMIAYGISFILLGRSDQMLIQLIVGDYETGLYSIAYRLGELSLILFYGLDSLWTVWIFARIKEGNYNIIRKRAHQYMLFFAGVTMLLMLIGPSLLRFITPETYWSAARLVPMVMTSGFQFMLYSICGSIELYYKKTPVIALGAGIVVILNIIMNIILLPIYGYEVAAATTVAAYLVLFLIHTWYVYHRLKHGDLFSWRLATFLSFILICFATFLYYFDLL